MKDRFPDGTCQLRIDLQSDNEDDAKIEIEKNYLKKLDVYKVTFNKDGNDYVFASVVKE